MKIILILVTYLVVTASALASVVSDRVEQDWRNWSKVGQAQLTMLFFDIYHSQLLTPSGRYTLDPDITPHPLALSITYQRDISQQQLIDATLEQWQKLGFPATQTQQWAEQLASIFPNIKKGHSLTYVTDGVQGQFYFSEQQASIKLIGVIEEEQLNDAFLAIWLSPDTEYPSLRERLIGRAQ